MLSRDARRRHVRAGRGQSGITSLEESSRSAGNQRTNAVRCESGVERRATKGVGRPVTQNQLTELLESEGAKAMLETGEERGWIEPAELEAFALEHELVDADVEDLTRELERIGLEVREARPEEKAAEVRRGRLRGRPALGRGRLPAALPRRRRPPQAADSCAGGHPRQEDRARRPRSRSGR